MASFNLEVQEGGYQGRPATVYHNIDMRSDINEMLSGAVAKTAGAAIDKYLTQAKPDKAENPALAPMSEKLQEVGRLAVANPDSRVEYLQSQAAVNQIAGEQDKYEELIDKATGELNQKAWDKFQGALNEGTKRLNAARAKAEQRGRNFNYEAEVMGVYNSLSGRFGESASLEAFKELMGTEPIKFMNDKLVEAEFAVRQKSREAEMKRVDDLAANYGLVRPVGSTDDAWAASVARHQKNMASMTSSEETLTVWNRQPLVGGKPVSADVRRPVEADYGYSIVETVGSGISNMLAGFDPASASTETRMSMMQQLDDVYAAYAVKIGRLMTSDSSLRGDVLGQLKTQIDSAKETLKSNTITGIMEGQNKMHAQKSLNKLYESVPNFGIYAQMNSSLSQFLQKDALFAGEFVNMINTTAGNDLAKLLLAGDTNALSRTPPSSKDWGSFVNTSLNMAGRFEPMRPVMALNSVRALSAAIDPFTGAVKDQSALVGMLTFYGDKRFLTYLYPEIKKGMGGTAYNNVTKAVLDQTTTTMLAEINKSPEVNGLISQVKDSSSSTLHLQFDKDGNVLIGKADAEGKFTPLKNQSAGKLANARNALSASIRAHAHLQGTDDYSAVADAVLNSLGVNVTATMPAKKK